MVTVNILEGLRFYVSFGVHLFGELKLLEGSVKDYFIYRSETKVNIWNVTKNYKQL